MFTLIIFLIVLSVIVIAHEFGHFITARKSGMRVYEFGIGFPPRALGWYKDPETGKWKRVGRKFNKENASGIIWSLNWLPLGGFVSIKGEEGENTDSDSFVSQKYYKKIIVAVAGVVMNFVLAGVLLGIGYLFGLPQMTDNLPSSARVENDRLEILQVMSETPAAEAEVKRGDVVLKIGEIENPGIVEMQDYVKNFTGEKLNLELKRGEEILNLEVGTFAYEDTGDKGIGVALAQVGTVKFPWYLALWYGFVSAWNYLIAIVVVFYTLIVGLFAGTAGELTKSIAGPIGIAVMSGEVARLGISYLLQFTALLSLNLAVLNILPIPALDGGRILFLTIGKIFGKQSGLKYENIAHAIGFILLIGLVLLVTFKDILGLF